MCGYATSSFPGSKAASPVNLLTGEQRASTTQPWPTAGQRPAGGRRRQGLRQRVIAGLGRKGPAFLGVRAVLAESFERIHRSNLIGMGVLPLQFQEGDSADSLGLTGQEPVSVRGLADLSMDLIPSELEVQAGETTFQVRLRIDTPREAEYVRHGGIMKYVVRRLAAPTSTGS